MKKQAYACIMQNVKLACCAPCTNCALEFVHSIWKTDFSKKSANSLQLAYIQIKTTKTAGLRNIVACSSKKYIRYNKKR